MVDRGLKLLAASTIIKNLADHDFDSIDNVREYIGGKQSVTVSPIYRNQYHRQITQDAQLSNSTQASKFSILKLLKDCIEDSMGGDPNNKAIELANTCWSKIASLASTQNLTATLEEHLMQPHEGSEVTKKILNFHRTNGHESHCKCFSWLRWDMQHILFCQCGSTRTSRHGIPPLLDSCALIVGPSGCLVSLHLMFSLESKEITLHLSEDKGRTNQRTISCWCNLAGRWTNLCRESQGLVWQWGSPQGWWVSVYQKCLFCAYFSFESAWDEMFVLELSNVAIDEAPKTVSVVSSFCSYWRVQGEQHPWPHCISLAIEWCNHPGKR